MLRLFYFLQNVRAAVEQEGRKALRNFLDVVIPWSNIIYIAMSHHSGAQRSRRRIAVAAICLTFKKSYAIFVLDYLLSILY